VVEVFGLDEEELPVELEGRVLPGLVLPLPSNMMCGDRLIPKLLEWYWWCEVEVFPSSSSPIPLRSMALLSRAKVYTSPSSSSGVLWSSRFTAWGEGVEEGAELLLLLLLLLLLVVLEVEEGVYLPLFVPLLLLLVPLLLLLLFVDGEVFAFVAVTL
jgi:hypothetical protein